LKHYSEKYGRKEWMRGAACQGGYAPSSPECEAFSNFVLEEDVYMKVYSRKKKLIQL